MSSAISLKILSWKWPKANQPVLVYFGRPGVVLAS